MQYKLIKKHDPANRHKNPKWYAAPVYNGKISAFQLNKQVIIQSKLDKDIVKKVVEITADEISRLLTDGYSVMFDAMGTFRVSFSSEGVEEKEDFSPEMINNIKVIFTPSVEFHEKLKTNILSTQ